MRTYKMLISGVPPEVLFKNRGVGPQLHLFLGVELLELDLFG
jgi:hypothetical protein